ncbi:protein-tyrosine-phosphatase [Bacillus sp. TS-2]|nr:protein-tyrosine-phosphatase [Bacillus sp. TS-2]
MNKINILFVCTGNTCRSPMAEELLKAKAGERFEVQSAGIFASPGYPASEGTAQVLKNRNLDIQNHQARLLTEELLDWADYVLTMTENHKSHILQQYSDEQEKIHSLSSFLGQAGEVVDPYGGPVEIYEMTAQQLDELLNQLIHKLS